MALNRVIPIVTVGVDRLECVQRPALGTPPDGERLGTELPDIAAYSDRLGGRSLGRARTAKYAFDVAVHCHRFSLRLAVQALYSSWPTMRSSVSQ
ncbi:MAG: hypothetical protein ACXVIS_08525 [Halobacteriota archaeon]